MRGILQNADRALLPGYFVRVRVPRGRSQSRCWCRTSALGSDQGGRYVLVVNKDNVVEQRQVEVGPLVGELRVIEKGLDAGRPRVVGGILRAIPGQKVDPQIRPRPRRRATQPKLA